jgi:pilus assembly protein CpaB
MKHPSRITVLVLAAATGLGATGLLHRATAAQGTEVAVKQPMVVAASTLSEREPLTAKHLKVVWVRERPLGAFTRPEELTGRLPAIGVPPGQPVLSSHLAPEGAAPGLSNRVPVGKRALTVGINEVAGVAGFLRPDSRVDIIGVSHQGEAWKTQLVAQDVPVLAIAQDDAPRRGKTAAPKVATSATLLVTPEQAAAISLATERGRIRLALRAPGDRAQVTPPRPQPPRLQPPRPAAAPAVKVQRAPAAAQPPVTVRRPGIEVIRGNDLEVFQP